MRAVVARGLPLRKKQMAEIFRRLYVHSHNKLPEEHRISAWGRAAGGCPDGGTLLQSGLKVDEDLPGTPLCYLEEVPAERVIATRTFITENDLLRILDWLQHLPPQRRMMLDLSNHNVPIPRDKWGWAKHPWVGCPLRFLRTRRCAAGAQASRPEMIVYSAVQQGHAVSRVIIAN